eukprot:COSAG02_NODE_37661_length_439_cov_0.682353_1_plen_29_part_10
MTARAYLLWYMSDARALPDEMACPHAGKN